MNDDVHVEKFQKLSDSDHFVNVYELQHGSCLKAVWSNTINRTWSADWKFDLSSIENSSNNGNFLFGQFKIKS